MNIYNVIVIGSGAGAIIAEEAISNGLNVALVDKGPLGGTCLNTGCIPSKLLIFPADRITEIEEAGKLGITAKITKIDFPSIMKQMKKIIQESQNQIRMGLELEKNLDLYEEEGRFIDDYILEVGGERIKGKKIFIASGARPVIPPIKGLSETDYLTHESVFNLTKKPDSLVIVGGGYIATEFGHFFTAMGTDVTILQKGPVLVPGEEPEVSELLRKEMEKRMSIQTDTQAIEIKQKKGVATIIGKNRITGEEQEFTAEKIMVAVGRTSNADVLEVEKTGVKIDKKGFIEINDFLETSKKNIWAIGDVTGREMFRHSANLEADLAWRNSYHNHKEKMKFWQTPHAVFSHPQIASIGLKEEDAKKDHTILVGISQYGEVAKGEAMMEEDAFAKAIVDKETLKILGFHIIGPYAPILIQEVVNAIANDGDIYSIARGMHIHPALTEVIISALGNLEEPHEHHIAEQ
jgi:dihydrolipoamide dehydrogenase